MKWMVIAAIGAALMVHGQEAKPHSNTHERYSTGQGKKATDTAGQTVIVVNQQTPQGQENSHPAKPPSYLHELFLPQNVPNIALVLVGIAGIGMALRTLKVLSRQTAAMERQVSAQGESLRARITIEFQGNVFEEMLFNGRAVVCAKFINTGGTPAYKVIPETWIEMVSPNHFKDFTNRATHHIGHSVAVYPTTPTLFDIPLRRLADGNDIAGLRQGTTTLAVRIRLTYESLGKEYFVDRAFYATPDGMQIYPKYNEAN